MDRDTEMRGERRSGPLPSGSQHQACAALASARPHLVCASQGSWVPATGPTLARLADTGSHQATFTESPEGPESSSAHKARNSVQITLQEYTQKTTAVHAARAGPRVLRPGPSSHCPESLVCAPAAGACHSALLASTLGGRTTAQGVRRDRSVIALNLLVLNWYLSIATFTLPLVTLNIFSYVYWLTIFPPFMVFFCSPSLIILKNFLSCFSFSYPFVEALHVL